MIVDPAGSNKYWIHDNDYAFYIFKGKMSRENETWKTVRDHTVYISDNDEAKA